MQLFRAALTPELRKFRAHIFRPFPLFNKEGEPTSEACIRAYRGIKTNAKRGQRATWVFNKPPAKGDQNRIPNLS